LLFALLAVIAGALLISGCDPAGSGASGARNLVQEYPWLAPLGLAFVEGLLRQFGSDLAGLLVAAAAALLS
jgi:hypothetical protein